MIFKYLNNTQLRCLNEEFFFFILNIYLHSFKWPTNKQTTANHICHSSDLLYVMLLMMSGEKRHTIPPKRY